MAGAVPAERLKYFSGCDADHDPVHVLLVSTSQAYLEEVQQNLFITREGQHEKRPYYLKVHTCKIVSDVAVMADGELNVDFIVFIIDVQNPTCLNEVENNMQMLDPSFSREKICLVNPCPHYEKAVIKPDEVWEFAQHYQLNLINGKIMDPKRVVNLSKRILNLLEVSCGIINGIPLVGYV